MCKDTNDAWLSLGKTGYQRQTAEEGSKVFRRSVYFMRDLPAGSIVGTADIRRIRPALGLAPKHFDTLVGKRLKVTVQRGTPTSWDQFDE